MTPFLTSWVPIVSFAILTPWWVPVRRGDGAKGAIRRGRGSADRVTFEPVADGGTDCVDTGCIVVAAGFDVVADGDLGAEVVGALDAVVGGGCAGVVATGGGALVWVASGGVGDGLGGDCAGLVVAGAGAGACVGSGWIDVAGCRGDVLSMFAALGTFAALGAGATGSAAGGDGTPAGCIDDMPSPATDGASTGGLAESIGRLDVHNPATVGGIMPPLGTGLPAGAGTAPLAPVLVPGATRSATATTSPALIPSAIPAATVTSASCQRRAGVVTRPAAAVPAPGGLCVAVPRPTRRPTRRATRSAAAGFPARSADGTSGVSGTVDVAGTADIAGTAGVPGRAATAGTVGTGIATGSGVGVDGGGGGGVIRTCRVT